MPGDQPNGVDFSGSQVEFGNLDTCCRLTSQHEWSNDQNLVRTPGDCAASAARPPLATAVSGAHLVSAFAKAHLHYNTRGSFLCHARDDSAYFWGADKKPAGDQFLVETARNAIGP